MKKILGLDIGTNSIGWAFIETNAYENPEFLDGKIIQLGSRIIPMDGDAMLKFESGTPESKAAGRRIARGARRLNHRYKLRRTRLIQALKILGWFPQQFPTEFKKLKKHKINELLPYSQEIITEAAVFFNSNDVKTDRTNHKISEDWLIYFLKTKALHSRVTLQELARILYHYNQRRGFKSSRKDNKPLEESVEKKYPVTEKWIEIITVTDIQNVGKGEGKDREYTFYELSCKATNFEFKAIKKRKTPLDWTNKKIEVEITKTTTKDQNVHYKIAEVDPSAWENRKKALEADINRENLYISEYYLKNLKKDLNYPIKQRIVDRSFYQNEFKKIWETQSAFYRKEFADINAIQTIADTFYKHNKDKNKELKSRDLFHIFFNDIIYFQRGLKSQKGLLASCQYETKTFKTKDGEAKKIGVKVASKSSPCFQEFRIWQTIHNLKILKKEEIINGKLKLNVDVSANYLNESSKTKLFELFDSSAEVSHDAVLKELGFKKDFTENGTKTYGYRLNYPSEKDFLGNETKALFRKVFKKHSFEEGEKILEDRKLFNHLWHIIYSLPEEQEIVNALENKKYFDLTEDVIQHLSKLPEFKRQYASLSSKAINKLLPIMRTGKYWNEAEINRLFEHALKFRDLDQSKHDPTVPEAIRNAIRELNFSDIYDFKGLPTYLAAYLVYGRHSELSEQSKYQSPDDLKINELIPYNSLRNPVVEKTIRETLKLIKDIWKTDHLGRPDFIHVELGREMKNNNEERGKISEANQKNRIEKDRVVALIKELKYPNFREQSLSDLEKFRVWKDNGGQVGDEKFEDLFKSGRAEFVKDADIEKYRRWAEQNYRSPYSGHAIPLSALFSEKYQVDHIIPKSRFFDDSSSNKVVVESEFNDRKGNKLAIQFIEDFQGKEINLSNGEKRKVLPLEEYLRLVDETFKSQKKKRYLKSYEVPEDFVERQMNDTKYIARTVAQFLRPIAKGSESDEGIVYTSGGITSDLKSKWGLHKLWKEILRPRFERLEGILGEKLILPSETHEGDFRFGKDYKRIDHRHHALDALVVACTSRSHIKYLNSLNSLSNNKQDIAKFGEWAKWRYLLNKKKQLENRENGMTEFGTPWENFYQDAKEAIESIIVSHKPSSKLVSKTINKFYKWKEVEPGKWEKKIHFQEEPKDEDKYWVAVRQSLFGQPMGKIHLPEYKKGIDIKSAIKTQIQFLSREEQQWNSEDWRIAKSSIRKKIDSIIRELGFDEKRILNHIIRNQILDENDQPVAKTDLLRFRKYASKRVTIDDSFTKDKIDNMPLAEQEKNWLTGLLRTHLNEYGNDPKLAFKGEALEMLFRKSPFPINKVTRKESGEKIEKNNKLLDGDKGVNQFFVVEIKKEVDKKTGEEKLVRKYSTPGFLECIERLAKGLPVHDENPSSKYIVLSPGDMVYVPKGDETVAQIKWDDRKNVAERIYIMKSSADSLCYFLPACIASLVAPYNSKIKKGEFESLNKSEKTIDGTQIIKENFVKLRVGRLGNIQPWG